ncbi:hypothetical protein HBP98_02640 [Listeria booriae]|uniref:Uncharacterized protein n=1 Tax=Listeria booriae TaxID=1552123 RepID=A0A7X1A5M5_9LIST|nr:hypothetical protein [Listeria booriae]MBC2370896.1 hypothetical protein [Listeria booriae]
MWIWLIIYVAPFLLAVIKLLRKRKNYKQQKSFQTWLYIVEIYYISILLTMVFTYFETGVFWLFNSEEGFETLLTRFFTAYALYQIFILIKTKLDNSADIDSYTSLKSLIELIKIYTPTKEYDVIIKLINQYEAGVMVENHAMINNHTLELFKIIKETNPKSAQYHQMLDECIITLEREIQILGMSWTESIFLNWGK